MDHAKHFGESMSKLPPLELEDMHLRHAGLSRAVAACYAEAARVCLDRHHCPPKDFNIRENNTLRASSVRWHPTNGAVKGAWANTDDATRDGAYAFALAAAEAAIGHVAVLRAETKTGADYYIAPADEAIEDIERCFRFEVSGVDHGPMAAIEHRLKEKLRQTQKGNSNLPALAGVVGFREAVVLLARVEE